MGIGISYSRTTQAILTKLAASVIGEGQAFAFPTIQIVGNASQAIAESVAFADSSLGQNSSSAVIGECFISPIHSNQQSSQSTVIAECITNNVISVIKKLAVFDEGVLVNPDVNSLNFTGLPVTATGGGSQDIDVAVATTDVIPVDVDANYTASARQLIRASTIGGGFTLTLPANPSDNAIVAIQDIDGTFETQPVEVVTSDGKTIDSESTWDLDKSGIYVEVRYNATIDEWKFFIIPDLCSC